MTRFFRNAVSAAALATMVMLPLSPAGATDAGNQVESALITLRATGATWQPEVEFQSAVLTVSGPDDVLLRKEFAAGDSIEINLSDAASGGLPDGQYAWEMVFSPRLSSEQKDRLRTARESGDEAAINEMKSKGKMPIEVAPSSGYFRISGGNIVVAERTEMPPRRVSPDTEGDAQPGAVNDQDTPVATKDQVILDDLIVDGSACIGMDCVNGESFGFDTLRLKENNLRIKFEDTSNTSSFPSNDWQLTANDTSNGGANRFSIDDISGGRTPFTIEAGARTNALYVESDGDVGIGTNNPAVRLHVVMGNTPTLRLEQDGSSGFTPQTWDIASNEANFFIRDATNGSKLPFRIRPGAPSDSIYIDIDGDVGIGTSSPTAPLEVKTTAEDSVLLLNRTDGGHWYLTATAGGTFTIGTEAGEGGELLIVDNLGNLTTSGTVNGISDRDAKVNFAAVVPVSILEAVSRLPITSWSLVGDRSGGRHMGPTAQDFHAAFGLGTDERHIALSDLGGVALAAIQALTAELEARDREVEDLYKRLEVLEDRLR